MAERYAIVGTYPSEYRRARDCIAEAYTEATAGQLASPTRFAEAVLARLGALDPPMLVVSLEEVVEGRQRG